MLKDCKIGDVGYDVTGREVQIIAIAEHGYICEVGYSDNEGEYFGGLTVVEEFFDEPPVEKLNEQIAALNGEIEKLQDHLDTLRGEARDMKAIEKQRLATLQRNKALCRIEDFLDGKITHYVELNYGSVKVVDLKSEVSGNDRHERDLKLLTLFGRSNGDLSWKLNHYSDGSGSSIEVFPCTSHEEAMVVAQEQIELIYTEEKAYRVACAVDSAKKLGFTIPDNMLTLANEYRAGDIRRRLKDATETAERYQKELDAL